jgi:hypothetical protein
VCVCVYTHSLLIRRVHVYRHTHASIGPTQIVGIKKFIDDKLIRCFFKLVFILVGISFFLNTFKNTLFTSIKIYLMRFLRYI